jgi:pimeloyl-ACP methyl ester carboxylesterase
MNVSTLESLEGFHEKWPFTARYARVNGWRMHYVDEGVGDPVLLLHGNPTWGFLYRDVIPPLVNAGHRVIVPDMIRETGPRAGAQPRWSYRELDEPGPPARFAAPDGGLP